MSRLLLAVPGGSHHPPSVDYLGHPNLDEEILAAAKELGERSISYADYPCYP